MLDVRIANCVDARGTSRCRGWHHLLRAEVILTLSFASLLAARTQVLHDINATVMALAIVSTCQLLIAT